MKIYTFWLIPTIMVLSCFISCEKKTTQSKPPIKEEKMMISESDAAKWLKQNVEDAFNNDHHTDKFSSITTPDYFEYKTDAINVDLDIDGSLSQDEFFKKWNKKFDVTKAGIGQGFFIDGQDWGKLNLTIINKPVCANLQCIFEVVLKDESFNVTYKRSIKVISENGVFKIADVLE